MKKTILLAAISCTIFLILPRFVMASTDFSLGSFYLDTDKVHQDNLVGFGTDFNLKGKIDGDVIIAGNSLVISGEVTGDVIAGCATSIRIEGNVKGNVRVAAPTVEIKGKIEKNVTIAGQSITFDKEAEVLGTIGFASNNFEFRGQADKKIRGWANYALIAGELKNDLELDFNKVEGKLQNSGLNITKDAVIAGNVVYGADQTAQVETGAKLSGTLTQRAPTTLKWHWNRGAFNSFWNFLRIVSLFGLLVVGMVLVAIWKKSPLKIADKMEHHLGRSFLWGLLAVIVVPMICFILMFTIIGIPLSFLILGIYFITLYLANIFVGLVIGRRLIKSMKKQKNTEPSTFWSMVLGVVIYMLVLNFLLTGMWGGSWSFLGWLGGLVKFFAVCWAVGAILMVKKEKLQEEK